MRVLGLLFGAAVAIAALTLAVKLGVVILLIIISLAFVKAPCQTLAVLLGLVLIGAFSHQPLVGMIFLLLLVISGRIADR